MSEQNTKTSRKRQTKKSTVETTATKSATNVNTEAVVEEQNNVVETTTVTEKKSTATKNRSIDDVKLNERVSIDNLRSWDISFVSEETGKDVIVKGDVKNSVKFTVAEIDAQVKADNVAFCGVDGLGSHAAFRINDPVIREYVFGEDIDPVQLTEDNVRKLLAIDNRNDFREALNNLVVTNSEKRQIVMTCEHIGVDNVESFKLNLIESISGVKFY